MLTEDKKRFFRTLLTQQLQGSLRGSNDSTHDMERLSTRYPDPADWAAILRDRDMCLALFERQNEQVERIREALARIDRGTYGVCDECERQIPEARLRTKPTATLCIRCQSKFEEDKKP
jgi:DnaK suppressor protein